MDKLIDAVVAHAHTHYNDGRGWDYVVEAWGRAEIAQAILFAETPEEAIELVGEVVGRIADAEADVRAEIF